MNELSGRRVLIVDDEMLIALFAEDMLIAAGVIPVGPASTLEEALTMVRAESFDAALLDVNLNGKSSEPVALALVQRRTPFVIVTGYGKVDWAEGIATVLPKPYTARSILPALNDALAARKRH